jgi:hypothetical protein
MCWAKRRSTCHALPAIQKVAHKTGMAANANNTNIAVSGNPNKRLNAQTEAAAAAPTKQNVSIVTPAAAIKQPNGLNACDDVLGATSGFIISCSMEPDMATIYSEIKLALNEFTSKPVY